MAARFYPQRDEHPAKLVHVVAELGVGAGVVEGGVFKGVLVGEFLHHAVEHLRESQVDEVVFLPHELAGVGGVVVQVVRCPRRAAELLHIGDEVGKDDLHILQARHPLGVPFQRDKSVVVDRAQRPHELIHGQAALADKAVHRPAVFPHGRVFYVHVAHIGPQVLDGLLRLLAVVAVGVVQVPQRRQMVRGKPVEQVPQCRRIRKNAHRL